MTLVVAATLVAAAYAARARFGNTPIMLSLSLAAVGSLLQGILIGWQTGLAAAGISLAATGFLLMTRLLNRTNTFALPALIAFIPLDHWWVLLPAFAISTTVSIIKYLKTNSVEDMKRLGLQTAVMGMGNQMSDIAELAPDMDGRVTKKTNLFASLALGLALSVAAEIVATTLIA
jgi:hypothetical protein